MVADLIKPLSFHYSIFFPNEVKSLKIDSQKAMSGTRSRSGSNTNRPAELLPPSSIGDVRNSTSSTHGTLSIASYYYNSNHASESYDSGLADSPSQPRSPVWPPPLDSISGSPRGRALNEITGGSSLVHRRTSGSIQRGDQHYDNSQTGSRPDFSGWASGLQFGGNHHAEGSDDSAFRNPASLDPFAYSEDTPPQITLSRFTEGAGIVDQDGIESNSHARDLSTTTEGDVGRFPYGNLAYAQESSASLQMGFGELHRIGESPPETPAVGSEHRMQAPLFHGDANESEGAFLTSNQNSTQGWDRYNLNPQLVNSPEE